MFAQSKKKKVAWMWFGMDEMHLHGYQGMPACRPIMYCIYVCVCLLRIK